MTPHLSTEDAVWYLRERLAEGARPIDLRHDLSELAGKHISQRTFTILMKRAAQRACPARPGGRFAEKEGAKQ